METPEVCVERRLYSISLVHSIPKLILSRIIYGLVLVLGNTSFSTNAYLKSLDGKEHHKSTILLPSRNRTQQSCSFPPMKQEMQRELGPISCFDYSVCVEEGTEAYFFGVAYPLHAVRRSECRFAIRTQWVV